MNPESLYLYGRAVYIGSGLLQIPLTRSVVVNLTWKTNPAKRLLIFPAPNWKNWALESLQNNFNSPSKCIGASSLTLNAANRHEEVNT